MRGQEWGCGQEGKCERGKEGNIKLGGGEKVKKNVRRLGKGGRKQEGTSGRTGASKQMIMLTKILEIYRKNTNS